MLIRKLFLALAAILFITSPLFAGPWNAYFPDGLLDRDGKPVSVEVLDGKLVGIYFSARWCPSCQAFSPKLVPFRDKNSQEMEVVMVSSDKNETEQFLYMKEHNMLWPTMKFRSAPAFELKKKFAIDNIPTLVILSPAGELITREGRIDVANDPAGALTKWKSTPIPTPTPTTARAAASRSSGGMAPSLSSLDQKTIAEVQAGRQPPKQGWFRGTVGEKTFAVTLDRVAWTITGTAGDKPFDIKIDHEARTIRGFAHDSGVDMTFTWNPEEVTIDGQAYGYPYWVTTTWQSGIAEGGYACSLLSLTFNLEKGTLEGSLGDRRANLKYDAVSGRLTGDLFRKPVDLRLENVDFSDFIQHLYLFVR